jgi:GNAT superfamily N-acetyltransferase
MGLTFQEETFDEFVEDGMDLVIDHWHDVALDKDDIPLDPNWDGYAKIFAAGVGHVMTARTETGELVGYSVCMMVPHLRYKNVKWAEGDVFFLRHDHRKGRAGMQLLMAAEKMMKALGAEKLYQKVKLHKDVGKVFEHLGYNAIERVYVKDLT